METDHKPLLKLYKESCKTCPSRIKRHRLHVQGFNYQLEWSKGAVSLDREPGPHTNYYSSRHPEHKNEVILDFDIICLAADGQLGNFSLKELRLNCQEDKQLLNLRKYIKQGFISKDDQE